jgi:GDP/UDP-N,N'-diacetylbacillosamine 2-epimerase (hydrolysing)
MAHGSIVKIGIVTGTRADYGLLRNLISKIHVDDYFELTLFVTGTHLSPEFGFTKTEIELFENVKVVEIESVLSSDSSVGVVKSMALAQLGYAEYFSKNRCDLMVILGDRTEILVAAQTCLVLEIPVAHISGGEVTEGAIDDSIRHAITKMSQLHFTATDEYCHRVIQLGENPDNVFNVGSLSVDSINASKNFDRSEVNQKLGLNSNMPIMLCTIHPETSGNANNSELANSILGALDAFPDYQVVFSFANSDTDGRRINALIQEFVMHNKSRAFCFPSLGQQMYLSLLKHSTVVIGNSSSGIVEAPSLGIPTINVGFRQHGRVRAESVLDVAPESDLIKEMIKLAISPKFQTLAKQTKSPFGDPGCANRIVNIIKSCGILETRKKFYDIT